MTPEYVPKRYVSLENQQGYSYAGPPPYGRNAPQYHSHRGSSDCGCLSCCCCFFSICKCCFCTILSIILLFVIIVAALYFFLKPGIPSYNVQNLSVQAFELRDGDKLYADIAVVVKAENPNKDIGLDYLENEVSIRYSGTQLCSGEFPPFLQPRKNTTIFNVGLKGESDFGPEMQHKLMQGQKLGNIPLLIMVKVPIRLMIDDFIHLRKFVVNVNCSLVIDQLQPDKRPNILKKEFTYGIHF